MPKAKETKTNAMRILETNKIAYKHYTYECGEFTDALQIADLLGMPYEKVYKTLVTAGSGGEKAVSMIPVKDINRVTGYVRGGCTAVGMKKQYATRLDSSAEELERIVVSGGRIGLQVELAPEDLRKASQAEYAALTV